MSKAPTPGSDLQNLIEQYRSDLIKTHKKKNLPDIEETSMHNKTDESIAKDKLKNVEKLKRISNLESSENAVDANAKYPSEFYKILSSAPVRKININSNTNDSISNNEQENIPPSMLRPRPFQSDDIKQEKTDLNNTISEPIKPTILEFDNDESPAPSMFWPLHNLAEKSEDVKPQSVSATQDPQPGTALLRVTVTTARQAIPISNALVTVIRPEKSNSRNTELLQKACTTDSSGNTPEMSIDVTDFPSFYTIEVSAPGYYLTRHTHVPLYNDIKAFQSINLLPLPENIDKSQTIVYNQSPPMG